jgi:hypothetical protein
MRLALIAGVALAGAVQFMPDHWHARTASIATYEEDASAQARFQSWRYALEVTQESPIVGGGFEIFRGNQAATSAGYRSAHSIYFEALAEHGYPGLIIFLALGIGAYMTAWSITRRTRDHPELAWATDLAAMVQVGIVAYAIAGLFLNLATFDLYYHLVAIVVIASSLVRQRLASGAPNGDGGLTTSLRPTVRRAGLTDVRHDERHEGFGAQPVAPCGRRDLGLERARLVCRFGSWRGRTGHGKQTGPAVGWIGACPRGAHAAGLPAWRPSAGLPLSRLAGRAGCGAAG